MAKVTGQAYYTADLKLRGMLVAKVLRSPHAQVRILSVDVSPALKVPEVKTAVSREKTGTIEIPRSVTAYDRSIAHSLMAVEGQMNGLCASGMILTAKALPDRQKNLLKTGLFALFLLTYAAVPDTKKLSKQLCPQRKKLQ